MYRKKCCSTAWLFTREKRRCGSLRIGFHSGAGPGDLSETTFVVTFGLSASVPCFMLGVSQNDDSCIECVLEDSLCHYGGHLELRNTQN